MSDINTPVPKSGYGKRKPAQDPMTHVPVPGAMFGAFGNDRQSAFSVESGTVQSEGWYTEPGDGGRADNVPDLTNVGRVGSGVGPMAVPSKQTGFDKPAVDNH
jgi:hypothetical protein